MLFPLHPSWRFLLFFFTLLQVLPVTVELPDPDWRQNHREQGIACFSKATH
jgi:hypothetical protein